MRLIGAGLPRTGTSSLREALRFLLDAPVHHMSEAFAHPEQAPTWVAAIDGDPPVWDDFLAGYAAGVDAPFSCCWRELAAAYPDVPVLLSHRSDPEVWLRSMEATVLPRTRAMLARDDDDRMVPLFRVIFRDVFTDPTDRAEIIAGYERRLSEVRAEIAPERLVEWQPGDGWGPLCRALGLPVPDRPFPHENSSADYVARSEARARNDRARLDAARSSGSEDPSRAWSELAPDYERARSREDSLDRLVEWPAQRDLLGDVTGLSVLDLGCGNGGKLAELAGEGATAAVGIDVSGSFVSAPPGVALIRGDLNELDSMPGLAGRAFDRILFLQSFGYAKDPVRTLRAARALLADDGFILLTRTQPIRYALERAEQNGTSLGEEYFATTSYTYRTGWNEQIALTKRTYTMSDLLNAFSAAGLWIETAVEPQLSEEARRRFPHKQEWMDKYLGILVFKLRPLARSSTERGEEW